MTHRLVVASGKGGTGKTLVSTGLAWLASQRGLRVRYVDADVEEPNGEAFLPVKDGVEREFSVMVPEPVAGRCTSCGACQEACAFHAILATPGQPMVFSELCHSCGLCVRVCPEDALVEVPQRTGVIRQGHSGDVQVRVGILDVGRARATPLVSATARTDLEEVDLEIVDASPGTSCSVIAALQGADQVLLVTEPTPSGAHDLQRAATLVRQRDLVAGVFLNRADLGPAAAADCGLPLVGRLPFNRKIAETYASGTLAVSLPWVREELERVLDWALGGQS